MVRRKKEIKTIELFYEKTGEVIRLIRFKDPRDFNKFLDDYKSMRYPGYGWRFKEIEKRKSNKKLISKE